MLGHGLFSAASNVCTQIALPLVAPVILCTVETLEVLQLFLAQYTVMKNINPGRFNVSEMIGVALVGNALVPLSMLYEECIRDKIHKDV